MARFAVFGLAGLDQVKELNSVVHKHISWAAEKNINDPKVLTLFTPEDPELYYFEGFDKKDVDVCFLRALSTMLKEMKV